MPIDPEPFVQYGILGAVLIWFMWRNEKVLSKLIEKIDELCQKVTENTSKR